MSDIAIVVPAWLAQLLNLSPDASDQEIKDSIIRLRHLELAAAALFDASQELSAEDDCVVAPPIYFAVLGSVLNQSESRVQ